MRGKEVLSAIKNDIDGHIGEKVLLRANNGRKKVIEREGILERTYPNIFVVRIEGTDRTSRVISYSYSDILTNTVKIEFKKPDAMAI